MSRPDTDRPRQNVLAKLDKRDPTSFYWSLTLLATLGGFLFGYDTANIGSAYHLTGFWMGYLVAGAAVGALLGGPVADAPVRVLWSQARDQRVHLIAAVRADA